MKKFISTIFALTLLLNSLTACNTKAAVESSSTKKAEQTLKIGASPSPHSEILEEAKKIFKDKNINLEIIEFTDYILPNIALDNGEIDANFFQHLPYLKKFNEENKTKIVGVAPIHFEPLGIYGGKSTDLKNIPDKAVISLPNDATNEARSLLLLESLGIIKLKEGVGLDATPIDIVENNKNIEFFEIESAQLVGTLKDVDFAIINGNYAVDGKIIENVLEIEDKTGSASKEYANYICTNEGNESNPLIKELVKVLQGEEIKKFINDRYKNVAELKS